MVIEAFMGFKASKALSRRNNMTQKLLHFGFGLTLAVFVIVLLIPGAATTNAQQLPPPGQTLSPGQLDDLVAPIALYPDPLISQILVAVTYPLEIVEANQWLQRNPNLTGLALTQAVERQDWDPSVQALVPFPDVLKYLTEDIAWTTSLGNAFLAQEADVMDAIQRMRASAAQAGKLTTTAQQEVTRTYDSGRPVYVIVPRDPDIIYVPVYDPFWVWGAPNYYPYARWYYPRSYSGLYFSRGVSLQLVFGLGWQSYGWRGWNDWGWRPGWNTRTVIVNNTFIDRRNFNSSHLSSRIGTTSWSHDVSHRQGVPYPTSALTERFRGGDRDNRGTRNLPTQNRVASVDSGSSRTTNSRVGDREVAPRISGRESSAFQSPSRTNRNSTGFEPRQVSPAPSAARIQPQSPQSSRAVQSERRAPERREAEVRPAPRAVQPSRGESQIQPTPRVVQPLRGESQVQPAPRAAQPSRNQVQPQARESQPSRSSAQAQRAPASSREAGGSRDSGGGGNSRGRR